GLRRRAAVLETAALVDGGTDDDAAGLHSGDLLVAHEFGARAPATSTAPMMRSASAIACSISRAFDAIVRHGNSAPACRSLPMSLSSTTTSERIPAAMASAFMPATPAPTITTRAGRTPATPPMRTPRPDRKSGG